MKNKFTAMLFGVALFAFSFVVSYLCYHTSFSIQKRDFHQSIYLCIQGNLYAESGADYQRIEALKEAYNLIPAPVRERMEAKGVDIYLDKVPEYLVSHVGVMGTYNEAEPILSIFPADPYHAEGFITLTRLADKTRMNEILLHEVGHFVDFETTGYPLSCNPAWQSAYEKERKALGEISVQCLENCYDPYEAFASAFSSFVLYEDKLKTLCPEMYAYISSVSF